MFSWDTPLLHQAAQQGHVQVINLLLKNKASPNAVTNVSAQIFPLHSHITVSTETM